MEPLAHLIRNNPNIYGIDLADTHYKLSNFVDNTLLLLITNPIPTIPVIPETLKEFSKGLRPANQENSVPLKHTCFVFSQTSMQIF